MVWIALLHALGCTLVKASRRINYAKLPNWLCAHVEELSEYLLVSCHDTKITLFEESCS